MEILLWILGYILLGNIIFFGIVKLEKIGINFDLCDNFGMAYTITLILSPIVIIFIIPYQVAIWYYNKH